MLQWIRFISTKQSMCQRQRWLCHDRAGCWYLGLSSVLWHAMLSLTINSVFSPSRKPQLNSCYLVEMTTQWSLCVHDNSCTSKIILDSLWPLTWKWLKMSIMHSRVLSKQLDWGIFRFLVQMKQTFAYKILSVKVDTYLGGVDHEGNTTGFWLSY